MILTQTWVPGHPKTKGSLTAKGGHATDTPASKRWRALMAERVRQDIERRRHPEPNVWIDETAWPWRGPVLVAAYFWLEPTTGKAIEHAHETGAATWPMAGDVDKLARNLLDALAADAKSAAMNGGAFLNDNQVINCNVWKFPADRSRGRAPGAWISVYAAPSDIASFEQTMFDHVAREMAGARRAQMP
jgi:hypothetical protein